MKARVGGELRGTALTDSAGNYRIDYLSTADLYTVRTSKAGYSISPDSIPNVSTGSTNIDFTLTKNTGEISGHVRDVEDTTEIFEATVKADDGYGNFGTALTDTSGFYHITGLATIHNYTLTATKYGYHDTTLISVEADSTVNIYIRRNYGSISGSVTGADSVTVMAASTTGGKSDTTTTGSAGAYSISGLPPDSYTVTATKVGYLSSPSQQNVNLVPGESDTLDPFTMEEARLATIEIKGATELNNSDTHIFTYTALSDTTGGKLRRKIPIDPEWSVADTAAVDSISSKGVLDPKDDYFGPATIRLADKNTGIGGELSAQVFQLVTPAMSITVKDYKGLSLVIPDSSVSGNEKLRFSTPEVPDAKRFFPGFRTLGQVYDLEPSGLSFLKNVKLTLPIPQEAIGYNNVIGRWNKSTLKWEAIGGTEDLIGGLFVEIDRFSQFAVLTPREPLGIKDVTLLPNPFSPEIDAFGEETGLRISYRLSSTETSSLFVTIKIYNLIGDLVRELKKNEAQVAERQEVYWDGKTDDGRLARNGRYIVQIIAKDSSGTKNEIRTVVLIR